MREGAFSEKKLPLALSPKTGMGRDEGIFEKNGSSRKAPKKGTPLSCHLERSGARGGAESKELLIGWAIII